MVTSSLSITTTTTTATTSSVVCVKTKMRSKNKRTDRFADSVGTTSRLHPHHRFLSHRQCVISGRNMNQRNSNCFVLFGIFIVSIFSLLSLHSGVHCSSSSSSTPSPSSSSLLDQRFDFHRTLTPDERLILFGHTSEVPHYDFIASPKASNLDAALRRRKRSTTSSTAVNEQPVSSAAADATLTSGHNSNAPVTIEFRAFDQHFRLSLQPNHQLLSPLFRMINELRDNELGNASTSSTPSTPSKTDLDALENCFYQGIAESHPGSSVAVSLCNGMQGVIETNDGVFVVTPLPEHTVERYRASGGANSSFLHSDSSILAGKFHIVLRHNDEEFNDYKCPHHQRRAVPRSVKPAFLQHVEAAFESVRLNRTRRSINNKNSGDGENADSELSNALEIDSMNPKQPILYEESRSRSFDSPSRRIRNETSKATTQQELQHSTFNSSSTELNADDHFNITVETAVFVDESLYHLLSKTFPVDTEQQIVLYVLTIMNAVQLLFKQPSIGRSVEISVVLMDLLKTQPKNLHPSDNIDTYLTNFCVWQHKKRLKESGGPTPDWDHALLLSGINMYVVDSKGRRKRHVVGLAPVSGMCNSLNSCTISEGTSFQTVLVAGHEMGHSLGMEHDGPQDDNSCNKDDFVMSPTLGPGKTTWSECSKRYLDKFVLTSQATCVLGRSSHVNIIQQFIPHNQLPGERFSVDDQCRFRFGPTSKHYSGQNKEDICRMIKCHVKPNRRKDASSYYGRSLYNPYPSKSTYNTHPALEGTECGKNMWCHEGRCVDKTINPTTTPVNDITESPISNDVEDIATLIKHTLSTTSTSTTTTSTTTTTENPKESQTTRVVESNRINSSSQRINKLNRSRTRPPSSRNPYQFKYTPSPPIAVVNSTDDSLENFITTNKINPYNTATTPSVPSTPRNSWRSNRINSKPRYPVNGNWSQWTSFGPCISECLIADTTSLLPIGVQASLRRCNSPTPQHGGTECRGPDTKVKLCNAFQTCSVESSISAASPSSRKKFDVNDPRAVHNLRYRLRTVEDFIDDTCTAAAKLNDKLENHGTQYPNYDSASHSCYVWCHKRGGGYVSQGWRLPDGTPCGRKDVSGLNSTISNGGTLSATSDSNESTGYCYNGQCRPFNCLGESYLKTSVAASSNVYSGRYGPSGSGHNNDSVVEETLDCSKIDHELDQLLNPSKISVHGEAQPIDDDSYSLIKIDLKTKILKSKSKQKVPAITENTNAYSVTTAMLPPTTTPTTPMSVSVSSSSSITPPSIATPIEPTLSVPDLFGPAAQNFYSSNPSLLSTVSPNQFNILGGNWSSWTPVTECQYSTACVNSGRGFRLVTRECQRANTCLGRREALQVCGDIGHNALGLYEQYCPVTKRKSSEHYARDVCRKYQIKYPNLLSGSGRQLKGKNAGCIVACEDRLWKDVHYQMDAFEEGKFPFGTDCSDSESGQGYCLNGKCIRFDASAISYDSDESVLQRNEILQLFAPQTMFGSGTFAGFSNNDLYSSISNELFKRANSHTYQQALPLAQVVATAASSPVVSPVQSVLQHQHQHQHQHHHQSHLPTVSPLNSNQHVSIIPTHAHHNLHVHHQHSHHSHQQPETPIIPIPSAYDELTFQVPRSPGRDLYASASDPQRTFRRTKRSAYGRSHLRRNRGTGLGGSSLTENIPSKLMFRKASAREYLDPESDYVSWRLVRSGRTLGPHFTVPPMVKKSLRPIKLTPFPRQQETSKPKMNLPEHFQTFTLVKHNKSKLTNNFRNWKSSLNLSPNVMPMGNQTHFLDDDEEEDDDTDNATSEEMEEDSESEEVESQTENPKKVRKNPNQYGLGHEAWPETETQDSQPKRPVLSGHRMRELRVEPYIWSVILSECSRPCGDGIRTVGVVCTVGQKTVDDRLCDPDQKPMHKHIEPCKERECIGSWRTEPWSACSSKCSAVPTSARNAYQSRNIVCVGPAIISAPSSMLGGSNVTTNPRLFSLLSHQYCDADSKPVQWKSCDAESMHREC